MSDARLDRVERLLDERGVGLGRVRVAAGRSGVAVGFPRDPMMHLSWTVLAGAAGLVLLRRRRSQRRAAGTGERPPRPRRARR